MVNIGQIPSKWAALTPGRDAIVDAPNGRRMNWRTLDERVRRLANGLRGPEKGHSGDGGLGLHQGDRVAILAKNSIEYQELYYAAGRAGLIAQPLNWRLGAGELAKIVSDGAPKAVITSDEWLDTGKELQAAVDVPHWLQFGAGGDGSYEDLLAAAPTTSRSGRPRSATRTRSSSSTPAARRGSRRARCTVTPACRSGCSTRPSRSGSSRPTSTC